jgi:diaminopimelate epimerase
MTAGGPQADAAGATRFYKLSGSGNDFVFFDVRDDRTTVADDPDAVTALCRRGEGVGADGVVLLDAPGSGLVRIVYLNSDGSRAALCGNATLCSARLAVHLGIAAAGEAFRIQTDSGVLHARVEPGGDPAFELGPVAGLATDAPAIPEAREGREAGVGFAVAGVPHLVVRVADAQAVDVVSRGRQLRQPTHERPAGANVNFVSPRADGSWDLRTFERGVEGETLACGTGAVATAALLEAWGCAGAETRLVTRSGRPLVVRAPADPRAGPTLAGEGRLVFEGVLRDWR